VAAGAATKRARGADEYRHCSKCSNIIRPDHQSASGGSVVYFDEDGDQQVSILTRRVYDCSCGHSFSTWTWQGLALLAAMVLGGVFLAGRGWQEGSFAMLLFGGALSLANVFVLRDVTVRFSHRRATSGP